ncbi:COG4705 family protein [Streptomyces violascens]|uniref:COG4705 family protein n=1 Tax=Streptomyces violascens TaxID=67381 RepID=UPI0036C6EA55
MSKVPAVTALFWIVKVLTTGMGETASDYLGRTLGPVPAGALGLAGLVVALAAQFRSDRYRPWTYWSAIVMVSVFGTMAADVVHVVAGIPYTVSAVAFTLALAAVLIAWYVSERTLSIHSIHTRRREVFYWATVLATFALGTAVGDLTAGTLKLGYLASGFLFTALIAVPALSGRYLGLNAVAAFWWAYVLTRPLGASFADWMGVPTTRAGLGWGTGPVTLALIVPIVTLVACLAAAHKNTPRNAPTR